MTTVHAAVAEVLAGHGQALFGVLGDANMQYVADFINGGGSYIGAIDERGAVMMAIGYARRLHRVGVVTVTHGPGLTNTLTSLVEAVRSRTPLVLLTGDTPPVPDYVQLLDVGAAVAPTGAHYRRVVAAETVADELSAALRRAQADRLPVVLDIPFHLLSREVILPRRPGPIPERQAVRPDPDALDEALGIIASASRPVVLAGRGAALCDAREPLLALAHALGAPVATTLLGRDLFRGDPCDLGVLGTVSHDIAIETVGASDCVIAFGAGLNQYTTAHGWLADGRAVVHVDDDQGRLDRYTPVTAGIVGDAAVVARAMTEQLEAAGHSPSGFRSPALADRLAARDPRADFTDASTTEFLDARTAMIELDEILPADRVIVSDVGRYVIAPWKYLHVPEPLSFTHTAAFGSIGLGIAAGVGASAADRTRPTVVIAGDGGAMMGLIEFTTAVREKLPLVVIVVNDRCYGAEWAQMEKYGIDPALSLIPWPSFETMASAFGGHGLTVRTAGDLKRIPDLIAEGKLPLMVDLHIDPAVVIGDIR
ncbi:thiamine pyrophosphate-binding protein [Amycolatopsis sp. K13G38]|uniref:Thiamine pyrophosphate-binding protein n=1 Tax=Amycolatopsis acididurans TaxID=2724524 RepID=A0ABX1J9E1_9PSEU|nr:thiamine pyrophosphate-binding protein [Amycolatopsis acididurans]NKQ56164.1 thiamine pyrophosphate-binding protein [Amycolatopsis acididurans]